MNVVFLRGFFFGGGGEMVFGGGGETVFEFLPFCGARPGVKGGGGRIFFLFGPDWGGGGGPPIGGGGSASFWGGGRGDFFFQGGALGDPPRDFGKGPVGEWFFIFFPLDERTNIIFFPPRGGHTVPFLGRISSWPRGGPTVDPPCSFLIDGPGERVVLGGGGALNPGGHLRGPNPRNGGGTRFGGWGGPFVVWYPGCPMPRGGNRGGAPPPGRWGDPGLIPRMEKKRGGKWGTTSAPFHRLPKIYRRGGRGGGARTGPPPKPRGGGPRGAVFFSFFLSHPPYFSFGSGPGKNPPPNPPGPFCPGGKRVWGIIFPGGPMFFFLLFGNHPQVCETSGGTLWGGGPGIGGGGGGGGRPPGPRGGGGFWGGTGIVFRGNPRGFGPKWGEWQGFFGKTWASPVGGGPMFLRGQIGPGQFTRTFFWEGGFFSAEDRATRGRNIFSFCLGGKKIHRRRGHLEPGGPLKRIYSPQKNSMASPKTEGGGGFF